MLMLFELALLVDLHRLTLSKSHTYTPALDKLAACTEHCPDGACE